MMSCRHCGTANESESENCRKCGRSLHREEMVGQIPCVNHANRAAISTCNGCAHRLCDLCAFTVDGLDFCKTCVPEGAVAEMVKAVVGASSVVENLNSRLTNYFSCGGNWARVISSGGGGSSRCNSTCINWPVTCSRNRSSMLSNKLKLSCLYSLTGSRWP